MAKLATRELKYPAGRPPTTKDMWACGGGGGEQGAAGVTGKVLAIESNSRKELSMDKEHCMSEERNRLPRTTAFCGGIAGLS